MHRELSFILTPFSGISYYLERSGLIKDRLYSCKLSDDKKTYTIRSVEEDNKHEQIVKRNHLLFVYNSTTQISLDGFFWDKFDCKEYDWVQRLNDSNYFICRKNEKYGIAKDDGVVIVDIVYPLITGIPKEPGKDLWEKFTNAPYPISKDRKEQLVVHNKPYIVIKVTTYDGEYLMDLTTMSKSKLYTKIYIWGNNYLVENKGKYGLISPMGVEIVPPNYSNAYPINETLYTGTVELRIPRKYRTGGWLEVDFNGKKSVIANNGKYYGEIPLEYDECIYVGKDLINQYLVKKNGKYGLISYNDLGKEYWVEIPIKYKSIVFNIDKPFYQEPFKNYVNQFAKEYFTFAIVQDEQGYQLYRIGTRNNGVWGEHYQSLEFLRVNLRNCLERERNNPHLFIAQKEGGFGLLSPKGEPLTNFIYQSIGALINDAIPICIDNKWGILNIHGEELLKCEFEEIINIYRGHTRVRKDGKEIEVKIDNRVHSKMVERQDPYKDLNMDEEEWDAMTDGQYGPYPGGDIDYDVFGF